MPHILHITETLKFGGAEKVIVDLANNMIDMYAITICCTQEYGELKEQLDPRINLVCLNKNEGNDYTLPIKLKKIIISKNIDIVHTHDWGVFLEGGISAILSNVKGIIHTQHGPYLKYAPGILSALKKQIRNLAEKVISRRYYRIVSVSESIKSYINNQLKINEGKVVIIHNGIENNSQDKVEREKNNKDTIVFITVGRLAAVKNQDMIITAFSEVNKQRKNTKLVIIGDGDKKEELTVLANKLGLHDSVEFLGFKNDVKNYLNKSDIFLMSSYYEGISIAILEAMRECLPIIGTKVGGIPETVFDGMNGYLVEPDDISSMVVKMIKLIDSSKLRNELGKESYEIFSNRFTIDNMIVGYNNIYKEIMKSGE